MITEEEKKQAVEIFKESLDNFDDKTDAIIMVRHKIENNGKGHNTTLAMLGRKINLCHAIGERMFNDEDFREVINDAVAVVNNRAMEKYLESKK